MYICVCVLLHLSRVPSSDQGEELCSIYANIAPEKRNGDEWRGMGGTEGGSVWE